MHVFTHTSAQSAVGCYTRGWVAVACFARMALFSVRRANSKQALPNVRLKLACSFSAIP